MATTFQVASTQRQYYKDLFKKKGVISLGTGYKIVNGEPTKELCLIVGVSSKKPISALSKEDIVPKMIDGIGTDVLEIGTPVAQAIDPTQTHRPIFPGISIGHYSITAGTFGCVVKRGSEKFILSNNHVLSASNEGKIGDAIYQPGTYDGGNESLQAATLEQFVQIQFTGNVPLPPTCPIASGIVKIANFISEKFGFSHRLSAYQISKPEATLNKVDAAIARPTTEMNEEIAEIGKPVGVSVAELGMPIQKYGRTTKYTTGTINQIGVMVQVSYGTGKLAIFENQLIAGNMSAGGDSGSAVLDMGKNVVGLLFAGSDSVTIINPIQEVLSALNVEI